MTPDWSPLRQELSHWRRDGLHLPLWWRDDDAITPTPELDQLLRLSVDLNLPIHIAVIPRDATEALAGSLADTDQAVVLVHGWAHQNHAPVDAKKSEFGQPRRGARAEIAQGLARLQSMFAARLLPMFVPPWNRMDATLVAALADQGYRALSTYTPRQSRDIAGLVQINTHIDPIHWKAGGGLVPPEQTITHLCMLLQDRRLGATDAAEPLGFLSHHLVHDAAIWDFSLACLSELLDGGATPCNLLKMKDPLP